MKLLRKAHLQVNTDLNCLTEVLTWFDQFNCPPIPYQSWLFCQLALAEGFTNVVKYAHSDRADLPINLEVQMFDKRIDIRIWDYGMPFDMDKTLKFLLETADGNLLGTGQRGLMLMYRTSDFLVYTRTPDDRNLLLFIKLYSEI